MVVVLSVVGRGLTQVGCKKFATTPGSVQCKRRPVLPNKLQGSPLIRLCATGGPLGIALEEMGSSKWSVQSICRFAPGKVLSSRLVLSCSSHQTDFRSFHLSKVKSCLMRQTDGLVPCWALSSYLCNTSLHPCTVPCTHAGGLPLSDCLQGAGTVLHYSINLPI